MSKKPYQEKYHAPGRCSETHGALLPVSTLWHNRSIPADLEMSLNGTVGELERLAGGVAEFCRGNGLDDSVEFDVNLVLEELFMNTIRHGGCRDQTGAARVRMRAAQDSVQLEYTDRGIPFNPLEAPEANVQVPLEERQPGGLGIHLIRQIMSDLRYQRSDGENQLTMARRMEAK